jgi:hypothetical protein
MLACSREGDLWFEALPLFAGSGPCCCFSALGIGSCCLDSSGLLWFEFASAFFSWPCSTTILSSFFEPSLCWSFRSMWGGSCWLPSKLLFGGESAVDFSSCSTPLDACSVTGASWLCSSSSVSGMFETGTWKEWKIRSYKVCSPFKLNVISTKKRKRLEIP